MTPDRLIVEAIKLAQDLLRQNLPPIHNLTDAATVLRLRELIHSPSIRSALDRSSDTLPAFALRTVERALSDHSRFHRETIDLLWDILDDPHLTKRWEFRKTPGWHSAGCVFDVLNRLLMLRCSNCVSHLRATRAQGLGPSSGRIPGGLVLGFRIKLGADQHNND